MTGSGRMRFLVIAVVAVSAAFLLASRWAGRFASRDRTGDPQRQGTDGLVGASAAQAPDMTFYGTLGGVAGPGKKSPAGSAADPVLRPAPGDTANLRGVFMVQALATRDGRQAGRVRDRLAARGIAAVVEEDTSGEVPVYRVRAGRFKERPAAEALAERIREKTGLDPWVLQESLP